jgi:uncharacterized membrane protein
LSGQPSAPSGAGAAAPALQPGEPSASRRAARFFLFASLLSGLVLAFVTPPFEIPDEQNHYLRIVRLAEGRLDLPPHRSRELREAAPNSKEAWVAAATVDVPTGAVLVQDALRPATRHRRLTWPKLRAAAAIPVDVAAGPPRRQVFIPNSLQFPPVVYAVPAVAVAVVRAVGGSALALLYAARLANLIVTSWILAQAIRRLPAFAWFTTAMALTPMALSLRASASPDAMTFALLVLVVALAAEGTWGEAPLSRRWFALLLAATAAAVATKAAYAPLCLLPLLIPARRWPPRRLLWRGAFVAAFLLAFAWASACAAAIPRIRVDVAADHVAQTRYVLARPLWFAHLTAVVIAYDAVELGREMIGKLGWLSIALPDALLVAFAVLLVALALLDGSPHLRVTVLQRGAFVLALGVTVGIVALSQYAQWTPYALNDIWGLQGRYFLPLAAVAAWPLHVRRLALRQERVLGWAVTAMSATSLVVTTVVLIRQYFAAFTVH